VTESVEVDVTLPGTDQEILVLIGTTASPAEGHNFRSTLYSLAKSLIPSLAKILATELAESGRRCTGLTYDVIKTGMKADLAPRTRLARIDRGPFGALATAEEAATKITSVIENQSLPISGAAIDLTGAVLP